MSYFGLVALILAHFLVTAAPAYLVLIFSLVAKKGVKLPLRVVLYLCAWSCYWVAVLGYGSSSAVWTHLLFYSGFLIPWIVIQNNKWAEAFVNEKFIIALCLLTILEAALFNSPIGERLYFFPEEGSERFRMFGIYQRPAGLGGNSSMTAGVLWFLVVLNEQVRGAIKSSTKFLVFATTVVLASGTGFALLMVYLSIAAFRRGRANVKYFVRGGLYVLLLAVALAVPFGFFGNVESSDKYSFDYAVLIYDYKVYEIEESLKLMFDGGDRGAMLLGHQILGGEAATSGDFGYLITLHAIGWIGALLLLLVPFLYPGALWRNIVPTLFFYLSFVHYPGLLSPPGQVLLACYLCLLARSGKKAGTTHIESAGTYQPA